MCVCLSVYDEREEGVSQPWMGVCGSCLLLSLLFSHPPPLHCHSVGSSASLMLEKGMGKEEKRRRGEEEKMDVCK